jgi:pyruvate-formate lyase
MYEFSPIAPRVASMRERYRTSKPKVCVARFRLVTEFYRDNPTMPPMLKRARNLLNLCENMPVLVNEDEVIVGELTSFYRGSALFPEYIVDWLFEEIRSGRFFKRELDPYDMDQEDIDYFMQQEDFWALNNLSRFNDEALPPEFHDIVGNGVVTFGDKGTGAGPVGHFCANYDKAIRKGFGAIKAEAQEKRAAMSGKLYGDDAEREQFYRAVTIVCDAAITLAKRYAAECRRQAAEGAGATGHGRAAECGAGAAGDGARRAT